MSLEHAILGFLNRRPFSGYDLKKAFDAVTPHFWPADQSQIYRALRHLRKSGWAQQEVVQQEQRPNRKVYRITPQGRREFRRWMTSFTPAGEMRQAALIQILFASELGDDEILPLVERHVHRLRGRLRALQRLEEQDGSAPAALNPSADPRFWRLTVEYGKVVTEAALLWLEGVVQDLRPGVLAARNRRAVHSDKTRRTPSAAPAPQEPPSARGRRDGRKPWES